MTKDILRKIIDSIDKNTTIDFDCPFRSETHVGKAFNYWHPIAQKSVNGVVYRIAEGFIDWEIRKKTYLLYKDENLFAVFHSVEGAKKFVDNILSSQ